jgi:hypothetical protein
MIKNNLLRLSSMIVALIFVICLNINAEEEKKTESLKFPGKIGLEYKTLLESGVKDSQTAEVADSSVGGNGGQVYMRHELKPSITFTPLKFFNIGVWLKDRMDFRFAQNTSSTVNMRVRNRFYTGADFIFMIDKVMTIAPGFEFRLNNDLNSPWSTTATTGGIEVRLTPILAMSGKYDFGLSWKINALFEFYLYPAMYKFPNADRGDAKEYYGTGYWGDDKNKLFQKFQIEVDKLAVEFEFFHFFAPKEIKCSLAYDMYLLATIYNPDFQNQYNLYFYSYKDRASSSVKTNMLDGIKQYIGFNFDLWGTIKPYIGFYSIISQSNGSWINGKDDEDDFNKIGVYTEFRPGIKTGINFKKDWLELGIGYTGVVLVSSTDPLLTFGTARKNTSGVPQKEVVPTFYNWENFIYSYLTIKL